MIIIMGIGIGHDDDLAQAALLSNPDLIGYDNDHDNYISFLTFPNWGWVGVTR